MPVQKTSKSKSQTSDDKHLDVCCRYHGRHNIFWGVVFIIVGFYWLAKSLGWLHEIDIPLFPLVLIILGVYFILRNPNHHGRSSEREEP